MSLPNPQGGGQGLRILPNMRVLKILPNPHLKKEVRWI